jgi:hypothetical protein
MFSPVPAFALRSGWGARDSFLAVVAGLVALPMPARDPRSLPQKRSGAGFPTPDPRSIVVVPGKVKRKRAGKPPRGPGARSGSGQGCEKLATEGCLARPACVVTSPLRQQRPRTGGREVECTALEMRHTRKGIGGSNPSLSATRADRIAHGSAWRVSTAPRSSRSILRALARASNRLGLYPSELTVAPPALPPWPHAADCRNLLRKKGLHPLDSLTGG